jgi:2-C-methyl-D-erythritol 4-phosphate cytidylyltransferase
VRARLIKTAEKPNTPNHAEWGAANHQSSDFRIYDELMTTARADSPHSRFFALIPCAGQGSRAGTPTAKQYQLIAGKALVLHTLAAFAAVTRVDKILVVVARGDSFFDRVASSPSFEVTDCGGASRAASVLNGLQALRLAGALEHDWVLVHDAARCLITPAQIDRLIDACAGDPVGGLLALKLPDTLKREVDGRVAATVDRADKWLAQTPQMFRLGALAEALEGAGDATTDESSAMEAKGLRPKLVAGSAENFKVTYAEDFLLAEAILLSRQSWVDQKATA